MKANEAVYSGYLINQTRLNNGLLIRPGKGGSASDFTAIATGESALPLAEQTAIISEVKSALRVTTGTAAGSMQFSNATFVQSDLSTNFTLGSGDFTIELWTYINTISTTSITSLIRIDDSTNRYINLLTNIKGQGTQHVFIVMGTTDNNAYLPVLNNSVVNLNINTWYHIAIVRRTNLLYLYINGIATRYLELSLGDILTGGAPVTFNQTGDANGKSFITLNNAGVLPTTLGTITHSIDTGTTNVNKSAFDGLITNVRVAKRALYTANFTVPSSPLQPVADTVLLLNVPTSGTYLTDSSTTNTTMTPTGSVVFSSTKPF